MFSFGNFPPKLSTMTVPLCEDSMGVAKEQLLLTLYNHIKALADEHNDMPRWKFWSRKKIAIEVAALVDAGNALANWSYRHGHGE